MYEIIELQEEKEDCNIKNKKRLYQLHFQALGAHH